MQERIAEYVATLKVKSIPDYETPARECSAYFDGRGIDMPNDSDWEAFKEYFKEKYKREKGKDISPLTLQQNYVARGKAFYRWCNGQQDDKEQTASLFEDKTEAIRPPAPAEEAEPIEAKRQYDTSGSETAEKLVRVNFLMKKSRYEIIAVLSVFTGKNVTDILTEAVDLYIREHATEADMIQTMGEKLRGKA